jgi:hypothetical protein
LDNFAELEGGAGSPILRVSRGVSWAMDELTHVKLKVKTMKIKIPNFALI